MNKYEQILEIPSSRGEDNQRSHAAMYTASLPIFEGRQMRMEIESAKCGFDRFEATPSSTRMADLECPSSGASCLRPGGWHEQRAAAPLSWAVGGVESEASDHRRAPLALALLASGQASGVAQQ